MNINGLSAKDENEYVDIVTKLVNDSEHIEQIKKEISDNKSKLFEQKDSITDWENFLFRSKK